MFGRETTPEQGAFLLLNLHPLVPLAFGFLPFLSADAISCNQAIPPFWFLLFCISGDTAGWGEGSSLGEGCRLPPPILWTFFHSMFIFFKKNDSIHSFILSHPCPVCVRALVLLEGGGSFAFCMSHKGEGG